MKKTVVIHQPDFFPYIGFFQRLLYADLFVILDDVQFLKRGWQHRDKIKVSYKDKSTWITLKIKKAPTDTKINKTTLAMEEKDKHKLLNQILLNYKEAPYYCEIAPIIKKLIMYNETNLAKFNINIIKTLISIFDINIDIIKSSDIKYSGTKNRLNASIAKEVKATNYLSGLGAKEYFEETPFKENNINVLWQKFKHPIYPQLHGDFIPNLSCIDLLFNCGIENSKNIIRKC